MTTAYERVQAARQKGRPTAMFYIERVFTDELRKAFENAEKRMRAVWPRWT